MSDVTPRPGPGYPRFFGELSTRMGDVRRADRRRYLQFFAELSPRLDTAKALEWELDRQLARRFNVFDYLSTAEVGLSSIIADLLNPEAATWPGNALSEDAVGRIDRDPPPTGSGHQLHEADQRSDGARHNEQTSAGHFR